MRHPFLVTGTYKGTGNPGKRGVKPYFSGSCQKLLKEHLEVYLSLKHKNHNQFWSEFFAKWWQKYPWKLDDKEEPPLEDPAKMTHLASVQVGEHSRKSKVEAALVAVSLPSLCVTESVLPRYVISESKTGSLTNLRAGVCTTTTSAFSSSFNVSMNPPTTNHANDL